MLKTDPFFLIFCIVTNKPSKCATIPCHEQPRRDTVTGVHVFPAMIRFYGSTRDSQLFIVTFGMIALLPCDVIVEP